MSEPLVRIQETGGIREIVLNRPDRRNALTRQLIRELTAAIVDSAQTSTRVVVLSGNGPAFCAGMDLEEMQQRAIATNANEEWDQDARSYRDLLVAILQLDVPTVAVVQGPAIAGGFGLVLACDVVLASTAARFALPEVKRGISPAVVSPLLLYRIGAGHSVPLLLAGEPISAVEAHRLGLCHFVEEPPALSARREAILASFLAGAPGAIAMTKRLVRSFSEQSLLQKLDAGKAVSAEARQTAEAREGLGAFLQKRKPSWDKTARPS